MLLLTGALLALVALLAGLQYRWLGQVGVAELERLRSSLRADVARFSQEFDREITRAYTVFSLPPPPPEWMNSTPDQWLETQYSERYERWNTSAPNPRLVLRVLRIKAEEGDIRLSSFNRETARLQQVEWPAELKPLRSRVEALLASRRPDGDVPPRDPVGPIIEDIPALVIPAMRPRRFFDRPGPDFTRAVDFTVVELDRQFLEQDLIPALTRQYFPIHEGVGDYSITIVSQADADRVIYRSDEPHPGDTTGSADATAPLFALRLDTFQSPVPGGPRPRPGDNPFRGGILRRPGGRPNRAQLGPPPRPAMEAGRWQLIVRHRSGSLETVVAGARRRNLAVSSAVLILLAGSIVLIVVSAQRSQRLARQQMDFVAGVSHELRTPLAVIRSAGENLADGVIEDRHQVRKYGSLIRDEGRRLTEMVEQVLQFSGLRAGRKLQMLPADVGELIAKAEANCQPLLEEKGFRLEKEIQSGLPPIMADANALSNCIENLLANAIKYSGSSRRIRIRVESREGKRPPQVQIAVEDWGPGIAPADLPHIFEPFYRGREAIASQIHGSGLGLSLVKGVAEAHGGRVTVESALGRGSVFTLHLSAGIKVGEEQPEVEAASVERSAEVKAEPPSIAS